MEAIINDIIDKIQQKFVTEFLEVFGDSGWQFDYETKISKFSPSIFLQTGYHNYEISNGVDFWYNKLISEETKQILIQVDKEYRSGERSFHKLVYQITCKDGTVKKILDIGVVIKRREDGTPLNIIGTTTDIENIKKLIS